MLDIGQTAPDFTLPRDTGATDSDSAGPDMVTLTKLRPHPVVLYFYPRDDTPGCTREAIDFSELLPEFQKLGALVMGISKDSVAKHDKFRAKHDLRVTLLSDADGQVCEDYGVWVEKAMYGRRSMGIERATFLIDGAGDLRAIWRKVKVPDHAQEVLAAVAKL